MSETAARNAIVRFFIYISGGYLAASFYGIRPGGSGKTTSSIVAICSDLRRCRDSVRTMTLRANVILSSRVCREMSRVAALLVAEFLIGAGTGAVLAVDEASGAPAVTSAESGVAGDRSGCAAGDAPEGAAHARSWCRRTGSGALVRVLRTIAIDDAVLADLARLAAHIANCR
jgi:hypothetical protein